MQLAFDLGWPEEVARPDRAAGTRLARSRSEPAEQPSLPGLASGGLDNLFLGLQPDGETADWLRTRLVPDLRERCGLVVGARRLELFHVSLIGLGAFDGVPPGRVAVVGEALRHLTHPGFGIAFDMVMRFEPSGAVVLTGGEGMQALRGLRDVLRSALVQTGLRGPWGATFTPHLTLCYRKEPFAACPVSSPVWRVREFALIHSRVGESRHVALKRWPLGA